MQCRRATRFRRVRDELPADSRAPSVLQIASYLREPTEYLLRCRDRWGAVFTVRWPGSPPMVYFTKAEPIRQIFKAPPDVLCGGRSNSVLDFVAGPQSVARLDAHAHRKRRSVVMTPFSRLDPYAEPMAANTRRAFEGLQGETAAFQEVSQALSLRNLIHCTFGFRDPERAEQLQELMLAFMHGSLNPVMATLWSAMVWGDPFRFRPQRFLDGAAPAGCFVPFGGGTRMCLGRAFALFQLKVVLATLLSRYELEPVDWPRARMVQRGLFTGVSHPVRVRVRVRA